MEAGRNEVLNDELSPVKSIDFGASKVTISGQASKERLVPSEKKANKFYDFVYYHDSPAQNYGIPKT